MGSPQQPMPAVITPQSEVHTMTAEAPSPPNPMQSLRERLIQEGSIVPSQANSAISQNSINAWTDVIKERMKKIFSLLSDVKKKFAAFVKCIQTFANKFSEFDFESKSDCGHFRLLGILNLHRILEVLLKRQDKRIRNSLVVRTGFFFAFKENMKNTP